VEGVLKLADFGASRQIQDIMTLSCEFKSLMGTPHFMAPEVIMQTGHGRSADIWSVACTVLEMFTGKPPFAEYTTAAAVMFHIASTNEPPFYSDNVSELAQDFLDKCFIRDQAKRWTAVELLDHPWIRDVELPYTSEPHQPITPPTPSRQTTVVPQTVVEQSNQAQRSSTPEHLASRLKQARPQQPIVPNDSEEDEKEEYMMDNNVDEGLISSEEGTPVFDKVQHEHKFEKQNYIPVAPKEGYDNTRSIHKFLKQRSVWQSRSFKQTDLKGMISEYNKKQQGSDPIPSNITAEKGTRSRSGSANSTSSATSSNYSAYDDEDDVFPIRDGTESPRDLNSPRTRKSPLPSPKNNKNPPPHSQVSNTYSGPSRRAPPLELQRHIPEDAMSLSSSAQLHNQQHHQFQSLQPFPSSPLDKPINTAYTDMYRKKYDEKKRLEDQKKHEFEEEQRKYLQQNMRELIETKVQVDLGDESKQNRAHTAPMKRAVSANEVSTAIMNRTEKDVEDLAPLGSRGKKQPTTPSSGVRIPNQIVTQNIVRDPHSSSGIRSPVMKGPLKSPKSGTPSGSGKSVQRPNGTPISRNVK
jgi:serine/threonine protein kinase